MPVNFAQSRASLCLSKFSGIRILTGISATANVNPAAISSLCSNWTATDADAQQHRLDVVRALFAAFPMIPAMKAAVAQASGEIDWKRVRPPLISLDPTQELALLNSMKEAGFQIKIDVGSNSKT